MLQHYKLPLLQNVVRTGIPTMLVGEAGSGKSHSVEQSSKELGLDFYSMSVGEQTTKSDILGFIDANGNYRSTAFREAFENGGVFLLDEVDAGNPNVLLVINTGLSNGFIQFPDRLVYKAEQFRLVATANTYGTGSGMQYVGRNKLDLATLNRFAVINWDRDNKLERALVDNGAWHRVIKRARVIVKESLDSNILISQRSALYGSKLLANGVSLEDTFELVITASLDEHTTTILKEALKEFEEPKVEMLDVGTEVLITTGTRIGSIGTVIGYDNNKYKVKLDKGTFTYGIESLSVISKTTTKVVEDELIETIDRLVIVDDLKSQFRDLALKLNDTSAYGAEFVEYNYNSYYDDSTRSGIDELYKLDGLKDTPTGLKYATYMYVANNLTKEYIETHK